MIQFKHDVPFEVGKSLYYVFTRHCTADKWNRSVLLDMVMAVSGIGYWYIAINKILC